MGSQFGADDGPLATPGGPGSGSGSSGGDPDPDPEPPEDPGGGGGDPAGAVTQGLFAINLGRAVPPGELGQGTRFGAAFVSSSADAGAIVGPESGTWNLTAAGATHQIILVQDGKRLAEPIFGASSGEMFYGTTPAIETPVGNTITLTNINDAADTIEAIYDRKATLPLKASVTVWATRARGDEDWHVMIWGCNDEVSA